MAYTRGSRRGFSRESVDIIAKLRPHGALHQQPALLPEQVADSICRAIGAVADLHARDVVHGGLRPGCFQFYKANHSSHMASGVSLQPLTVATVSDGFAVPKYGKKIVNREFGLSAQRYEKIDKWTDCYDLAEIIEIWSRVLDPEATHGIQFEKNIIHWDRSK